MRNDEILASKTLGKYTIFGYVVFDMSCDIYFSSFRVSLYRGILCMTDKV